MADPTRSAEFVCLECGLGLRLHIHYSNALQNGDLQRACFDRSDWNWEGYFCPDGSDSPEIGTWTEQYDEEVNS